jgi:hypothetical protein
MTNASQVVREEDKIGSVAVLEYLHNFFFSVLGLELRAFTLSHSASPFL